MRKTIRSWERAGFLFSCVLGPLLHFLFRWSAESPIIGVVCSVNESSWEHMKLMFVPIFFFAVLEAVVLFESCANFFAAKGAALAAALPLIPALYYTLNGAFGKTPAAVNIAIYYAAVAAFYLLSYSLLTSGALRSGVWQVAGFLLFWLLAFSFVLFTYRPPQLPLFIDPLTGRYGIP